MTNNFYYFLKDKSLKMLLFGFSSGLPILLVFSTLSVWLSKAGIERSTITLFSWAGFAYAFKYLWSPIIDKFSLPIFKKFGHRRSWLLLVQLLIILSLLLTSFSDPQKNLYTTAIFIVFLAFFSASQDIIIDAFRIESVSQSKQGYLSSMYIAGYRIGMLVSGAGSLWLASYFGSETYDQTVWQKVYCIMALFMSVGIFANFTSNEPKVKKNIFKRTNNHLIFFLSILFSIVIFVYFYSNIGFSVKDKKAGFPSSWLEHGVRDVEMRISEQGTLMLKNTCLNQDYLGEAEGVADNEGWIDTGDLVEVVEERVLFKGRLNGAINVGGNKVIPEEVEEEILKVPGVFQVAVRAKPSSIAGSLVEAYVVPESDVENSRELAKKIKQHCKQVLPSFKVPAFVRLLEELPIGSSGKVKR